MSIEKRIIEAPYMTSALRREASEELTRLRNALAHSIQMCAEHRDGRLAALERVAALEAQLQEQQTPTPQQISDYLAMLESINHGVMHNAELRGRPLADGPA